MDPLEVITEQEWQQVINKENAPGLLPCCEIIEELRLSLRHARAYGLDAFNAYDIIEIWRTVCALHDMNYSPIMLKIIAAANKVTTSTHLGYL